jgi:hypothetical protein
LSGHSLDWGHRGYKCALLSAKPVAAMVNAERRITTERKPAGDMARRHRDGARADLAPA